MRQLFIAIISLTVLLSCSSPTNKERKTDSDLAANEASTDFQNYISTLDQIPLPLKINPNGQLPDLSIHFNKKGFEMYKNKRTVKPFGIYYKDDKTIGIIDYSIGDWAFVPFLTTYDLNGNKIDSTGFYTKSGLDMGYQAIEYVSFNADRTVTVLDTVKRWDLNEDETDIIEGSMKISTGKVMYRVLDNGWIEKK